MISQHNEVHILGCMMVCQHKHATWLEVILAILLLCFVCGQPAFALCGDVSGDGSIMSNDVLMVARASIGTINLAADQKLRADVTLSGTTDGEILSNDVLMIARASIGTLATLLCQAS
jgi:hypothetical protein